jgi:hypothetical protein
MCYISSVSKSCQGQEKRRTVMPTLTAHGHKRTLRPISKTPAPALTHDEILLNFAREVLKYESAQLNIHFAGIGLTSPCPCDDCRHIEQYPSAFFKFARDVVRRADWMDKREQLAKQMLADATTQANRLLNRAVTAVAIGKAAEAMATEVVVAQ